MLLYFLVSDFRIAEGQFLNLRNVA